MAEEERQGFWKKYYLKEEETPIAIERVTDGRWRFFSKPAGPDLGIPCAMGCASHPTFAVIFFILGDGFIH